MYSKVKEHKKGAIFNGIIGGLGVLSTASLSLVSAKIDNEIENSDTRDAFRLIAGALISTQVLLTAHSFSDMAYHIKSHKVYKDIDELFVKSKKEAK